jgi:hypothetical protein
MSSGRGQSPSVTGPRELRLDVICPGTLAAASRRNDGSGCTRAGAACHRTRGHINLLERTTGLEPAILTLASRSVRVREQVTSGLTCENTAR